MSAAEKKRLKRLRQKEAKQAAAAAATAEAAAEAAKDDVDAVLASLGLPTKPGCCAFGAPEGKQCKTKVGVIGQVCDHCKLRFCLMHAHAQKYAASLCSVPLPRLAHFFLVVQCNADTAVGLRSRPKGAKHSLNDRLLRGQLGQPPEVQS